jgi:hypothetical protein
MEDLIENPWKDISKGLGPDFEKSCSKVSKEWMNANYSPQCRDAESRWSLKWMRKCCTQTSVYIYISMPWKCVRVVFAMKVTEWKDTLIQIFTYTKEDLILLTSLKSQYWYSLENYFNNHGVAKLMKITKDLYFSM